MELTFFSLFAIGFTAAWVIISFILDKKTGTSVLSYALFVVGCLLYYVNEVFFGSFAVILGICMLLLFFLIYKHEHDWDIKDKKEHDKE